MYNAVGKIMNLLCIETHCQEVTFTGIFNLDLKGFGAKVKLQSFGFWKLIKLYCKRFKPYLIQVWHM